MLDLYYRYHWACVQKRMDSKTSIQQLNSEVVMEIRRELEWLISEKEDWNKISLDTWIGKLMLFFFYCYFKFEVQQSCIEKDI